MTWKITIICSYIEATFVRIYVYNIVLKHLGCVAWMMYASQVRLHSQTLLLHSHVDV
jgi:hypothetical protein